jgi:hypothetical protein
MKIEAGWNLIRRLGRGSLLGDAFVGSLFLQKPGCSIETTQKSHALKRRPLSNPLLEPLDNG